MAEMTTLPAKRGVDFTNESGLLAVQKSCKILSNSELVPTMYQAAKVGAERATANCMIALDLADRTGANPLMIMQNLNIIQGKPSFSSAFLIGTINTCGRYETLKYKTGILDGPVYSKDRKSEIKGLKNMYCYAYTWEKGQVYLTPEDKKEQCLVSTNITMQMAVDEGWLDKAGSKWNTMPAQMLKYRAAAFWCRAFAPELSMGMRTTEEITDGIVDAEFEETTPVGSPATNGFDDIVSRNKAKIDAAKAMQTSSEEFANAPVE